MDQHQKTQELSEKIIFRPRCRIDVRSKKGTVCEVQNEIHRSCRWILFIEEQRHSNYPTSPAWEYFKDPPIRTVETITCALSSPQGRGGGETQTLDTEIVIMGVSLMGGGPGKLRTTPFYAGVFHDLHRRREELKKIIKKMKAIGCVFNKALQTKH